jgi:hypothetical protein
LTVSSSGPPVLRHRRAAGLIALLLAAGGSTVSGCGTGCTGTTLQVQAVEVGDTRAPLTVSARLTRDGRPLAGVQVKLAVNLVGDDNAHTDALFYADTDADGRASVTRREGVAGLSFPNHRVTGYAAYFQPLSPLNGVAYCWSSAGAPITCRTGDAVGTCPRD